jgi:hypothetical protein
MPNLWTRLARLDARCIVTMESLSDASGRGIRRWRVTVSSRSGPGLPIVAEDDSALTCLDNAALLAETRRWHLPEAPGGSP